MSRIAFITFVDDQGHDVGMSACDVLLITERQGGSTVLTRNGTTLTSTSSVADMKTKIDTAATADPL